MKITENFNYNIAIRSEKYFNNYNKLHREDGPAVIDFYRNGRIKKEIYYENGLRHREDGPALIVYHKGDKVKKNIYFYKEVIHRNDGPARIVYTSNGKLFSLIWVHKNKYYFHEVKKWMEENNFNSWVEMSRNDYNRMWFEIL